ncbi:SFT2-domain-containing protein [Fistulina hepatica ATCC 64428]|nr:SFT2-domain-containing protein [Fistulina hepatica ATCC 64428]
MSNKGWFNLEAVAGSASSAIPDNTFFEGDSAFSSFGLSRTTRLYGFIGCLAVGFIFSLLGSIFLIVGFLSIFAVFYVLGTIVSLIGTGFLIGFMKQLKLMFKPVRVIASAIFLASIIMVLVAAFALSSGVSARILLAIIIEFLAYTWYTISYIPYARTTVLKTIGMA